MHQVIRSAYLEELIHFIGNGRVKVVTGLRRCGKTVLLFGQFRDYLRQAGIADDHVLEIRLDIQEFAPLCDPDALYRHVMQRVNDEGRHFVLIDEIQEAISAAEFRDIRFARPAIYKVINGFLAQGNLEVYVTGSNSRFLSSNIMTEFSDRGTEVRLHPFSFREFCDARDGDAMTNWNQYLVYGGMPSAVLEASEDHRRTYLSNLFSGTYRRDIIERYGIRKTSEMDAIVRFLASSIGSLSSAKSIARSLRAGGSSISDTTTIEYLAHLAETFIIDAPVQQELKGKDLLRPQAKYYFEDIGLRNAILGFPRPERGRLMENVVHNELVARGYLVKIGRICTRTTVDGMCERRSYECDFVASKTGRTVYVQSAWSIEGDDQFEREVRPFRAISDSCPKFLVVGDMRGSYVEPDGVIVVGAIDFLLDGESLDRL